MNSESPALGSPPISHFQDEEPIKFDKPSANQAKTEGEAHDTLPANLETRRKKRDSSGTKLTIRRMSVFNSPEEDVNTADEMKTTTTTQILPIRAGAKRKLSTREDGAKPGDDFTFSRKASASSADESSSKEDKPPKLGSRREPSRIAPLKPSDRKALGEKDVNCDPVSPKKIAKKAAIIEEKEALRKATKEATLIRMRDRRTQTVIPDRIITAPQVLEIELPKDLPPKTPATIAEIFSAPSTEDSARPQAGRCTPPPGDLGGDSNGRPGRRARTQVNYAEPSLAAKMRRPTKEMLDAVGKDGRPLHGILVKKGVEIKLEPEYGTDSAWKSMPSVPTDKPVKPEEGRAEPGSPLSKKSTSTTEPMTVKAELEPILPSAASQAIAALIKDSKTTSKRRTSALRPALDSDSESKDNTRKEREKRGSSIYDFTSSSPPRSALTNSRPSSRSSDRDPSEEKSSRTSRRYSSLATLTSGIKESSADASRVGTSRFGTGAAGHKRTASGTTVTAVPDTAGKADLRASRRRSMML
jgi:hypothetical protein